MAEASTAESMERAVEVCVDQAEANQALLEGGLQAQEVTCRWVAAALLLGWPDAEIHERHVRRT